MLLPNTFFRLLRIVKKSVAATQSRIVNVTVMFEKDQKNCRVIDSLQRVVEQLPFKSVKTSVKRAQIVDAKKVVSIEN